MFIGDVWEQYKKQRDGDYFTDNASFVFVPTASGARGYDAVRQFLSTAYDSRTISVREKVIIRTTGENSIVEESETTIIFNSGDGVWLAPGVDSRFMIDSQVVIPTVSSSSIMWFGNYLVKSINFLYYRLLLHHLMVIGSPP
jgi:hypothetical protein